MRVEVGFEQIRRDPSSVVTIGTFDGVHLGHLAIIRYLLERTTERDGISTLVTFYPHPREVIQGRPVPVLTTIEERAAILEKIGLDRFVVIPFTKEFSRLPAEDFVADVLVNKVGVREVVIGYDHGFGHERKGNASLLREMGPRLGFEVDVIPVQVVDSHVVSSSEIRRSIERGDVETAAALLGRRYSMIGKVVAGDGRGRTIGFPTANLEIAHPQKIIPADGVYAVLVEIEDDVLHPGMMNIGVRPTVDGTTRKLEVHLIDFEEDLYGRELRVEFVGHMRPERKFASLEELTKQLSQDRLRCKAMLEIIS